MWGMIAAWSLSFFFRLDPIVTMVPIGLAAMYPSPSWDERAKHPAP